MPLFFASSKSKEALVDALILASDAFKRITEDGRLVPKPAFEETGHAPRYKSAGSTLSFVAGSLAVIAVVAVAFSFLQ